VDPPEATVLVAMITVEAEATEIAALVVAGILTMMTAAPMVDLPHDDPL
jgi:hypothetical protein